MLFKEIHAENKKGVMNIRKGGNNKYPIGKKPTKKKGVNLIHLHTNSFL
jgi:hypothetical protein